MNIKVMSNITTVEDARLVEMVRGGDRDAFAQLVARYQSPVCALAYSACGDVCHSEDVAQETFLIAWRKLAELKEPSKFKSWLYGIARNLINNTFRRQTRNPLAGASSLDVHLTAVAPGADPAAHTISREEEAILWHSLEQIPPDYRDALVLFYREQQSIGRVAEVLEISEDAARQRLSRGRKMLQEQVLAVVEGALARTAPGQTFAIGVIGALPALTMTVGSPALGGAALKGSAAGKAAAVAGLFGPLAMILPAGLGMWLGSKLPESQRERKFLYKAAGGLAAGVLLFVLAAVLLTGPLETRYFKNRPDAEVWACLAASFLFVAFLIPYTFWMAGRQRRIQREETKKSPNARAFSMSQRYEFRSAQIFLGLPLIHVRFNCVENGKRLPAKGWIAVGEVAYGVFACGAVAVGVVSWGAMAIGGVALGGAGFGILAFGGLAAGMASVGGMSVGYVAYGGAVLAWLGGLGGAVVSHHFALGGGIIAEHANDEAAKTFIRNSAFFHYADLLMWPMCAISFVVPPAIQLYVKRRAQRRLALQSTQ